MCRAMCGRSAALLALLGIFAVFTLAGCGKKADPFIPKKPVAMIPSSIKAAYADGEVVFKGRVLGVKGGAKVRPGKLVLRLEYNQYPEGKPPCDTCPIDFGESETIVGRVSRDKTFVARWPVSRGKGPYVVRLRIVGNSGGLGPPSDNIYVGLN